MNMLDVIRDYYVARNLKVPTFDDAMKFVQTELGEVYELDLARIGGYTRNNPENKPIYSKEEMGKEIGDTIMMLEVAGEIEGVDALQSLLTKLGEKVGKEYRVEFKIIENGDY